MSESIGYCECCGILDHHRIEGLCAGCIKNAVNYDEIKDDISLGMEAADTSTIDGFNEVDYDA